jgi:hypothetical protein
VAEVNNFYAERLNTATVVGSVSTSWSVIGTTSGQDYIPGTSLAANTKYLVVAQGILYGDSLSEHFGIRVNTADDSNIATDSAMNIEPMYDYDTYSDRGKAFFYAGSYSTDASPANIGIEIRTWSSGHNARAKMCSILLIDLDDLGSGNYVENRDAGGGAITDTSWGTTMAAIASGSLTGDTEYFVIGSAQIHVDDNKTQFYVRLMGDIDADNVLEQCTHASEEGEDAAGDSSGENRMCGVMGRVLTASSPSVGIEIQAYADKTNDYAEGGSYLIALDVSAFEDFEYDFDAVGSSVSTTEATIAQIASYSPTTGNANHLVVGRYNYTTSGNSEVVAVGVEHGTIQTEVKANHNSEGQSQIWDSTDAEEASIMAREAIGSAANDVNLRANVLAGEPSVQSEYEFLGVLSLELAGGVTTTVMPALMRIVGGI